MLFTHEQARALVAEGAQVVAIDFDDSEAHVHEDSYDGIKVWRCPVPSAWKGPLALGQVWKIHRFVSELLQRLKPNVVLLSFLEHKYLPLFPSLPPSTRVMLTVHGFDGMLRHHPTHSRWLRRRLLRQVDTIMAVSQATADLLRQTCQRDIFVVPNGINKQKFDCINQTKPKLREQLGLPRGLLILSVANFVSRKGLDLVLRARARLVGTAKAHYHIIIGRGPEQLKLHRLIAELGLEESTRVDTRPYTDSELARTFLASDIFGLASRTEWSPPAMEGFGIVYAEASYAGLPVIGGDSGGVSEVVDHGETGWLVDPLRLDAVQELALRLQEVLDDEELRASMGSKAKARAQRFDWSLNARALLRLSEQPVLESGPP